MHQSPATAEPPCPDRHPAGVVTRRRKVEFRASPQKETHIFMSSTLLPRTRVERGTNNDDFNWAVIENSPVSPLTFKSDLYSWCQQPARASSGMQERAI